MENEAEMKQRILESSRDIFFKFGFSRITVDEIAGSMGISKKTIYKYFTGKDEIIKEVAEMQMREMNDSCALLRKMGNIDFLQRLKATMANIAESLSKMGKPLFEDLAKNNPQLWKSVSDKRAQSIEENFGGLLREGMEQGLFRKDIDRELVMMIYATAIQGMITPENLMHIPYSAAQVYDAIIKVIFEGILTEEARAKYLPKHTPENILKGDN